jgi:superfamily I DNA/RNA helicase
VWLDKPIKISNIYFSENSKYKSGENYGNNTRDVPEQMAYTRKGDVDKSISAKDPLPNDDNSKLFETDRDTPEEHKASNSLQELPKSPNSQQKQAIEADINANLRVLAGPGSGKSKVIEWRYEYLIGNGVDPDKIVVCTFGKPAATEIGQRIARTCPQANLEQICTINALCYRLLAKWYSDSRWYKWQGPKDWQIKKTLEDIVGPLWQEKEKPNAQEIYNYINTSKYHGLTTDNSYEWFVDTLGQQHGDWLYDIRSKFDAWLNRNKFMTFADQLFLVEQQLKNDSSWRSMVQGQFSHVIVDEGQDTNYQAMRILITISLKPDQNTVYESEER